MMTLILFIALTLSGFGLTHFLIRYSVKHQLLDIANHRSSHVIATPRIGGVSFVILISLLLVVDALVIHPNQQITILLGILLPCAIVAITALVDDIKSLSQKQRFLLYLGASTVAVYMFPIESSSTGVVIAISLLFIISFTWLINLFNFMDGIDGIATSEAIFVLLALAYFTYSHNDLSATQQILFYIAPILGFLLLNWQPAKIFMGDSGSTFLGCLVGCLLLKAVSDGIINIYSTVILLGCFLTDATWTLTYRLVSGQQWYNAHRSHSYQILARRLKSHQSVTMIYTAINLIWLFPLALYSKNHEHYGLLITIICFLPLTALCFIIGAGKKANN